jgi:hypothetical protein
MSWEQRLDVLDGQIRLRPTKTEDRYTVEGLVKCSGASLEGTERCEVWLQDVEHLVPFADPEHRKFEVVGGTVKLEPRSEPNDGPPSGFLALCRRLLRPDEQAGEERCGYQFSANLQLRVGELVRLMVKDTSYRGRTGQFVAFKSLQSPFTYVDHEVHRSAESLEALEDGVRREQGWPSCER